MATAEAETSQDEHVPQGGVVYDGFISYSHAADDLLAPRLQAGLQRFAKPWWKRRALRIFRDESSLSANPHLWSSITDALDQSAWFVLLLSPDAAESPWVNSEVEYWLEHRDSDRIIAVLTDGEFGWADGDVAGDSVPPALQGALADEPRWVDLRFARTEEQLDLKNPRFSAAIADVASAIRGVPKDELESEEVRQHRRTVRSAWAAGIALLLLVILASSTAIYAIGQQSRANDLARQEANARQDAESQQQAAEAAADSERVAREAEAEQRAQAQAAAQQAEAEALAANSLSVRDVDPELSVLLALESLGLQETPSGRSALHQAIQTHRTIETFPPAGEGSTDARVAATISPQGELLAIGYPDRLEIWDAETYERLGSTVLVTGAEVELSNFLAPTFTTDGSQVIVPVWSSIPLSVVDKTGIYVVNVSSGEVDAFHPVSCLNWVQPAGGRFADPAQPLIVESRPITDGGCSEATVAVSLLSLDSGAFRPLINVECCAGDGVATLSADASRAAIATSTRRLVVEVETGSVIREFEGEGPSTISADGTEILFGWDPLQRRSIDTGELLQSYQGIFSRAWFSADGSRVYGTARQTGSIFVFDTESGAVIVELRGHQTRPSDAVMSPDGNVLISSAFQEGPRLWDLAGARGDAPSIDIGVEEGGLGQYLAGMRLVGDLLFVDAWTDSLLGRWDSPSRYILYDLAAGMTVREADVWSATLAPDGAWIVEQPVLSEDVVSPAGREGSTHIGQMRLVDPISGAVVRTLDSCDWYWHPDEPVPEPGVDCELSEIDRYGDLEVSADGSVIVGHTWDWNYRAWDAVTGETIRRESRPFGDDFTSFYPIAAGVSPDGSHLVTPDFGPQRMIETDLASESRRELEVIQVAHEIIYNEAGDLVFLADLAADLTVIDAESWTELTRLERGQGGSLRDVDLNSEESHAATAGFDNFVRIWDLASESIVEEIEVEGNLPTGLTDVEFLTDTILLVVASDFHEVLVFTIDTAELISFAKQRITRGFTEQECATYGIDPCPTLEDLRSGSA